MAEKQTKENPSNGQSDRFLKLDNLDYSKLISTSTRSPLLYHAIDQRYASINKTGYCDYVLGPEMYLLPFGPAEETDWLFVSFPLENKRLLDKEGERQKHLAESNEELKKTPQQSINIVDQGDEELEEEWGSFIPYTDQELKEAQLPNNIKDSSTTNKLQEPKILQQPKQGVNFLFNSIFGPFANPPLLSAPEDVDPLLTLIGEQKDQNNTNYSDKNNINSFQQNFVIPFCTLTLKPFLSPPELCLPMMVRPYRLTVSNLASLFGLNASEQRDILLQ
ncbi:MAG: hypothetical protein EZS28_010512 [Streblomastix strix]|uniref:Uncharacterized protein n=1 Tax=Streblomastix strix TaxID=222440 RepID=A0A5J4WI24_9EUKA|nr:MAG: hypothetical protein EZS28_010512 [Streblomastix strix]